MRLLTKSDIDQKKAIEVRQAREEGLKLARRVDSLREVQAQEEKSLQKFRAETLATIHEETKEAAEKRDTLKAECQALEDARRNALRPLTEELAHIEREKTALRREKETQDVRHKALETREKGVAASENSASLELSRAFDERRRATEFLAEAEFHARESRLAHAETEAIRDSVREMKRDVENDLRIRDTALAAQERSQQLRSQSLDKRESNLAVEWKKLEDREATLKRNLARK